MPARSEPQAAALFATRAAKAGSRICQIDALRYVAIFGIVLIHVFDSPRQVSTEPGAILNQIARFAVPIFFLNGGFFLAQKKIDRPLSYAVEITKRLGPVYLVWTLLYNIVFVQHWANLFNPGFVAIAALTGGLGYHLWFLPAYGICLSLTVFLLSKTRFVYVVASGGVLYLAGLAVGSYGGLVFGLPEVHDAARLAAARNGPLFGTLFVILGYWLGKSGRRMKLAPSAGVFLIGLVASLAEAYWLDAHHYMQFVKNDFLFGTVPMAFGAFCVSLAAPPNWPLMVNLSKYGPITLGIYAVHLLFLLELKALLHPTSIIGMLIVGATVLVMSTASAAVLKQVPVLRYLVV